jgi:hypothetical protein
MRVSMNCSSQGKSRLVGLLISLISFSTSSVAATDVAVSIGGEIKPGVYGRVDIGTRPPPPVMYPQPVVIVAPPRQAVPVTPVYMHVPPGHSKKWDKHCHKYHACGQPVYFVKGDAEDGYRQGHGKHKRHKHDD